MRYILFILLIVMFVGVCHSQYTYPYWLEDSLCTERGHILKDTTLRTVEEIWYIDKEDRALKVINETLYREGYCYRCKLHIVENAEGVRPDTVVIWRRKK